MYVFMTWKGKCVSLFFGCRDVTWIWPSMASGIGWGDAVCVLRSFGVIMVIVDARLNFTPLVLDGWLL